MFSSIGGIIKVLQFFLNLWGERNSTRARGKAQLAKEIVDVFKETDKKKQASGLNVLTGRINRFNRMR